MLNGEDELITALGARRQRLEERIVLAEKSSVASFEAPGSELSTKEDELARLRSELDRLCWEISRRNSRRCSMQLSAFLSANRNGEEDDPDIREFWRNRY